jgi:hypothetical protein
VVTIILNLPFAFGARECAHIWTALRGASLLSAVIAEIDKNIVAKTYNWSQAGPIFIRWFDHERRWEVGCNCRHSNG